MTKSAEEAATPKTAASGEENKGFVRDWVVPIVLGLAIGTGVMIARPYVAPVVQSAFQSKAMNLVDRYDPEDEEATESLEKDLHALGAAARGDLVKALVALPAESMETKIWLARQIAGEPWFDTASLKEILKDSGASKADRRAAACALLDAQHKEVDTELILPVLVEWLQDEAAPDRGMAVMRLDRTWRTGMLSSKWEAAVKRALLDFARRRPGASVEEVERLADDRAIAILTLPLGLPDPEVMALFWSTAKDETDDDMPRINAVRALAESNVLDEKDLDDWLAVSRSANGVIRQTVADNLFRATLPAYDKVLEPLQFDALPFARSGALDSQIKRRRPTMLARFDELTEDSLEWVRFNAMFACGVFKSETEGLPARAAIMLRAIETSEDPVDVQGAVLALRMLTDENPGFLPTDIHLQEQTVEEASLRAFMKDKAGRKEAAAKWRAKFGAAAVWTDDDRAKTLEKLLKHADPKNVEKASIALEKLRRNK